MVRIKRGNVARKRRKKVLSLAKGFRGTHSRLFRVANAQVMKALKYAYVGRKQKKRQFCRLWITRINAKVRGSNEGMNYSLFINKLKTADIELNRKMLSQLAIIDPTTFEKLQNEIK
jgi:large subunit ribosomal protein L20